MKSAIFSLLFLTSISHSTARADDYATTVGCPKLSELTCSPGTVDDGTGSSWAGKNADLKKRENERLNSLAVPFFTDKLRKSPDFRAEMIRLSGAPDPIDEAKLVAFAATSGVAAINRKFLRGFDGLARELKGTSVGRFLFGRRLGEEALYGDFFTHVTSQVVDPTLAARIRSDFTTVRLELMAVIQDRLPPGPGRDQMVQKVSSVQFHGIDCNRMMGLLTFESRFDGLLVPNAFYNPVDNKFTYCNGLGHYNSSLFQRYFVIAHELTHSVDPCAFERDKQSFPAPAAVSCLRGADSIGAAKRVPWKESTPEPHTACASGDQIGEAFSDFLAAEVLARLVPRMGPLTPAQKRAGFSNALRFPGECSDSKGYDVHPRHRERIDRILGANRLVQELLGCSNPAVRDCGR